MGEYTKMFHKGLLMVLHLPTVAPSVKQDLKNEK